MLACLASARRVVAGLSASLNFGSGAGSLGFSRSLTVPPPGRIEKAGISGIVGARELTSPRAVRGRTVSAL